MITKWFIPLHVISRNKKVSDASFIGKYKVTDKRIVLFNKNELVNYYFSNPVKTISRLGYIAERSTCPNYFKNVILREY